uniref:Ig-like domain-containing protein n=1 Tax=Trichuris muris TaxID=70415 RepID=A0A5S6QLB3_TRIMR
MLVESEAIRSDHVFERQDLPCDMRFPTCVLSSVCAFEKAVSSEVSEAEPYTSEKMDNYASCRWLSDPFLLDEIDFNSESDLIAHTCGIQRTITVQLKANGRLDAIVCWFRVNLFGDIEISSHPANKTSWDQAVFPLYMNDTMQNGSEVRVRCIISNNVLRCQIVPIDAKVQTSALVCPSSLVALLNDMVLLNSYRLFMQSTIGAGVLRHSAILDVTDNPLIALLATKLFGAEVWSQCKPQCIEMFEHQSSTCSNGSVVLFGKVEDVVDVAPCTLLLCCPVSSGGDLRRNALKQVWYSRANLEITQVIPECMEVHCILVECEQLEDYTYLVNDDRTLGFKVREQINPYRTLVQRELKLNQLVYTPLSSPFRLMTIDLQEPLDNLNENAPSFIKQYATTVVPTTREGIFNAVVFWFNLKCPSLTSVCFNTSESANHFKVAAALIKPTTVAKNALIEVCAQLDNGILTFYPNF